MSHNRQDEAKTAKKDQTVWREVLDEIDQATDRADVGDSEAQYRHVNRDQARGDWDRSRRMDE